MSRGFVREGDQEELPMVPQRAHLPEGLSNFVTAEGMEELVKEKEDLIKERDNIRKGNENENRVKRNYINAKLNLLKDRISSARLVGTPEQQLDEITFGATVSVKNCSNRSIQTFRIVGVDEANITGGKLSFISPLAKVLMNKKKGNKVLLKRDREDIVFEVIDVIYK